MKTVLGLLLILLICSSCYEIDKDDLWVGDYKENGVTNRKGQTISCNEERLNDLVCVGPENFAIIKTCLKQCRD